MIAIVVTGSRPQLPGGDAAFAVVVAEQRQGHLPQPGQVLRRVALPRAAAVLAEQHVQAPVLPVLDAPVAPHPFSQPRRPRRAAADVVRHLVALPVPLPPHPDYLYPRPEIDPLRLVLKPSNSYSTV